jgi:hypothetical protein
MLPFRVGGHRYRV